MEDHSTTYPRGVIQDLLVKVGKFIFLVDVLVLGMKENEELSIILGRPFLINIRALVDIHDSKLTLRMEDEEITFEMNKKVSDEGLIVNALGEENKNELDEIEKLLEE